MDFFEISIGKLIDAIKKNNVNELKAKLSEAKKVVVAIYRLPRFKLKIRAPNRRLIELNAGIVDRLEYALFKAVIEAARNDKLPVFKDIATIASDYKASAKYLVKLSEMGYVVFTDPYKAIKLEEAVKAVSESKYQRSISKALDLPIVLNFNMLEENSTKINCHFKDNELVCDHYSHGEERDQEKLQVKVINEYLRT